MLRKNRRSAFTLVELLVVIAIIGILISLLLPAVQQVRSAARWTACKNNLKQMAVATLNYQAAFQEFPPGCNLNTGASWQAYILPYLEQQNLYDLIEVNDDTFKWQSDEGKQVLQTRLQVFRCAEDPVPDGIASENIFGNDVFPERVPSSYIAVSSGSAPNNEDVSNSEITYTNLEAIGNPPTLARIQLVKSIRSGVLTATQNNLKTVVGYADIYDGSSNTAIIGESIFDTTLELSSGRDLDSDHWCIGSYRIDWRHLTDGSGSDSNRSSDESEVMGSTGVRLNLYHFTKDQSVSDAVGEKISWAFGSWHPGDNSTFSFADGSTRVINAGDLSAEVYANMGHKEDGQVENEF